MNPLKEECLKIIDSWIKKSKNITQIKQFIKIQDFIYDDLEYIKTNEAMLEMSEYLNKGDNSNKDLIKIRKYLCL